MNIKDPVEQRKAETHPVTEDSASTLPHGEKDEKLLKPQRSCINCEHLGEDWTCRMQGKAIGNPFEDQTECGDWKPAGASLGLTQTFPPCTPEYENLVQETVEKALADSGQSSIEPEKDAPVQKGKSLHQKAQKK